MIQKRRFQKILSLVLTFFILCLILNLTGVLDTYELNNTTNEPSIKSGSTLWVSNIGKPNIGDFIVFEHIDSLTGNNKWLFRLVGKENDTVKIRNGIFYRNGKNIDKKLALAYDYKVSNSQYYNLEENQMIGSHGMRRIHPDTLLFQLSESTAKSKGLVNQRFILPPDYVDETIQNEFGQPWNKDNFGPLVVPQGKFFVLGDNRDNSYDSRYIGLVDREDVVGVVLLNW